MLSVSDFNSEFRKPAGQSQVKEKNVKERNKGITSYNPVDVKFIKMAQNEAFREEIQLLRGVNVKLQIADQDVNKNKIKTMKKSSSLYKLDPFLDEDGVLRVGGRLGKSSDPYDVKHPVILPKKGHVTNLILCHYHQLVKHQGRGITQNEIRSSGYWIVGGSSVVSNHISKCVSCRKLRGSPQEQDGKPTGRSPRTSSAFYILCCGLFWSLAYQRRPS